MCVVEQVCHEKNNWSKSVIDLYSLHMEKKVLKIIQECLCFWVWCDFVHIRSRDKIDWFSEEKKCDKILKKKTAINEVYNFVLHILLNMNANINAQNNDLRNTPKRLKKL